MRKIVLGWSCVMATVGFVACGTSDTTGALIATDAGSDSPAANTDGGTDDAAPDAAPPGCDATKSPKDDPCVITDGLGVFVAPTGDDAAGQGTMSAPFLTFK